MAGRDSGTRCLGLEPVPLPKGKWRQDTLDNKVERAEDYSERKLQGFILTKGERETVDENKKR